MHCHGAKRESLVEEEKENQGEIIAVSLMKEVGSNAYVGIRSTETHIGKDEAGCHD